MSDIYEVLDHEPSIFFRPPTMLRHPDVQNLVATLGLRPILLRGRAKQLHQHSTTEIIDCGDGVRLSGELNRRENARGMIILFHGWEGCSRSLYILSAAAALFAAGYSVFRLNFRDHGDSHHLNKGLFNSTLIGEVLDAVRSVQSRWPHEHTYLGGYSLGGNFALRVALAAPALGISLRRVAAVCPVIDPAGSLLALEQARFFYHRYFVQKWRNSLLKKLRHFPEYGYEKDLGDLHSLRDFHDFFVPRFTEFAHRDDYFRAYAIRPDQLQGLEVPTTIINSKDDPITPHSMLPAEGSAKLSIELTDHGSHCAFLQDYSLNSWVDQRLLQLFK